MRVHLMSYCLCVAQQTFVYQILVFPSPCELPSSPLKSQTTTRNIFCLWLKMAFPVGSVVKNRPAMQEMQETWVQYLGQDDLAWGRIENRGGQTGEPGRLQFIGSQRVRHNWSNWACTQRWHLRWQLRFGHFGEFPSFSGSLPCICVVTLLCDFLLLICLM